LIGSWKIARLFGIDIRLHWTFALLVFYFLLQQQQAFGLYVLVILFGSVLLHELGHSLTAKRFGIQVLDISFWPLGGMARMSEIPEEPRVEGWVAIAGPAVNFGLIALGIPVLVAAMAAGAPETVLGALWIFIGINAALGTFNLVPAFPMDGGRILRALLARKLDYVRATEIAVKAGRFVAVGMIALTLVLALFANQTLCVLPLIALFVWYAGGRELLAVRLRHGLSPFARGPLAGPLAGAFARATAAAREAGPRDAAFEDRESSAPEPGPFRDFEPRSAGEGPRRPSAWEPKVDGGRRGGFSEEELRRLERFPGRLPRKRDSDPLD